MGSTARNYHAHGGNEWGVGGKLTFLPGAVVEGADGLFDLPSGGEPPLSYMAPSEATTVAALREEQKERLATARDRERFWRMALDDGILQLVRAGRLDEAKEKVRHAAHLSGTQS